MLVIPAIDLKDGEAVRLYKGDYNKKVVYSSHPEELAAGFEKMGAKYLHVVDQMVQKMPMQLIKKQLKEYVLLFLFPWN